MSLTDKLKKYKPTSRATTEQKAAIKKVEKVAKQEGRFLQLAPESFKPDPNQPRQTISEDKIIELREKIELAGQLQAILVKTNPAFKDNSKLEPYLIIAGERRWRAIKGSKKVDVVDAVIRTTDQDDALKSNIHGVIGMGEDEIVISDGLVTLLTQIDENKERENVVILDEALSYKKVVEELGGQQDKAALILKMSEASLSKYLSLLSADERIKRLSDSNVCQDLATLYTANNLIKISESDGVALLEEWDSLKEDGHNMRELTADKIREVKQKKKENKTSKHKHPKLKVITGLSICKDKKGFVLELKIGKTKTSYSIDLNGIDLMSSQLKDIKLGLGKKEND